MPKKVNFDPNSVIEDILDIFECERVSKRLSLKTEVLSYLRPPYNEDNSVPELIQDAYISHRNNQLKLPCLHGDKIRFTQVLINIIKNALKHT